MATQTRNLRQPSDPGPDYFTDKKRHIEDHTPTTRPANTTAPTPGSTGNGGAKATPGADFMSNDDIQKFSEHIRKNARHRAVERAMDAAQLEAVLRTIPDASGSMAGARMRARRVTRHLKRIARAEQVIAKSAAGLYAQFETEYESELRKIGKGRTTRNTRQPFGWK